MRLRTLLVLGTAVRLVMSPFFAHPFDVFSWYMWGERVLADPRALLGFLAPYGYSYFVFAFPATLAFSRISGFLPNYTISASSLDPVLVPPSGIFPMAAVPGILFDFLVKLPLIASDVLIAVLLHRFVLKQSGDAKLATTASMLWFLNPLAIWISSGWGTFDTLPALFTVATMYCAARGKNVAAGFSLAGAIALKYYASVLVFPLTIYIWKKSGRRAAINSLAATAGLTSFFLAPNFFRPFQGTFVVGVQQAQSGIHYSGLSAWTAITLFTPVPDQTLASAAIIALTQALLCVWFACRKSERVDIDAVATFCASILLLLLFYPSVGENFFIWALPYLAILAAIRLVDRGTYILLSLIALSSSATSSLLPFYLLPISPWIGDLLVRSLVSVGAYRVAPNGGLTSGIGIGKVILATYGVAAAIILLKLLSELASKMEPGGPRRLKEWLLDFRKRPLSNN